MKDESAIVLATPYIMPHRYDAQNMITEYADMDILRKYINGKREEGHRITYMALVLAAYYKAYLENPKINRFVMNKHIYQRSHFCVSFVMLKKRADGTPDEALLKVYMEPDDTIFSIQKKVESIIAENADALQENGTDKFANAVFTVPLLPNIVVGLAKLLDRYGILPKKIIEISPFHTSLFITNLASINTEHIFHHAYEFGTTSVFMCMGKPVMDYIHGDYKKKLIPLSCVMDERICGGVEYAQFWSSFNRYLKHPELTEQPGPGKGKTEDKDESEAENIESTKDAE
ncbi:MAG: hypothetical protein J5449_00455 [Oscillospiraceae bacterium]|nr:hypothetical protein [Oscillospiraceae bacterium]